MKVIIRRERAHPYFGRAELNSARLYHLSIDNLEDIDRHISDWYYRLCIELCNKIGAGYA